jgi:hypothetical protein
MSILRVDQIQHSTGTAALTIDSSGRILTPNRPSFHATGTVTETAITTSTKLPFNTKYFDSGNNYDAINFRFTAPVSGTYYFYLSYLTFNVADPNYATLTLGKNGTTSNAFGFSRRINASQNDRNLSTLLELNVNDYIEPFLNINIAGTYYYYLLGGHAHFFGYLVG